ncbi:right-handed parallel beta-helix repeat-containing protein [Mariniphaga sp.]|uniref:right-handed parallel beta-helix repeat-containing protein n=1 Tax=Mariniphaga sp. TaxID=1954475 RepID=UPI00356A470E
MKKYFVAKNPWTIVCLPVLLLFFTFSINAKNYYVSNSGNDSNAGTAPETAWRTINQVNNTKFAPGDSILFERGGVWREGLKVPSSGASDNPIVFGAYDSGAKPVIDGADIISGMTNYAANIWKKAGITTTPNLMYLNGTVGIPQTSLGACTSEGDWYYDSETDVVSIYSANDPSGNVELGQRKQIVDLGSYENITLSNLTIQHSNESISNSGAVRSSSGSNIAIRECTIQKSGRYGAYFLNSPYLTIDNNIFLRNGESDKEGGNIRIHSSITGISNITFTNNQCNYSGDHGFLIGTASKATHITNVDIHGNQFNYNNAAGLYIQMLDSAVVYNNTFDGNGDPVDASEDYAIGITSCDNTDIYQNTITNQIFNDAIQLYADTTLRWGSSDNLRIFRNYIYGVVDGDGIGASIHGHNSCTNLLIAYNMIAEADHSGISLYHNSSTSSVSSVDIFNNTFYNNTQGAIWTSALFPLVLKNNIFTGNTATANVRHMSTVGGFLTTSNNLWYTTSGNVLYYEGINYSMATITDFEPSAQTGDPLFTDAADKDFTLQTGSPAINNGVDVGLKEDILGNPIVETPHIGAYESQKKSDEDITKSTTEEISICDGESYQNWTESGQYERTLTAASGADSVVTTNLTVNPVVHVSEDISILEGENYNGWTETGQYKRTLTAITGCDSIVTTNLTVALNKYTIEDIEICEGNSYEEWTTSGEHERTLTSASGADSIVTTNLTVNLVYYVSEDIYLLEGENYNGWSESGQYERTLTAVTGCDSIVTTSLFVHPHQIQSIVLEKDWNIFSSSLIPSGLALEDVLENLQINNLLIEIQDENGKTYRQSENGWINDIGEIQVTEGYKIRVHSSCVLEIKGHPVKLPLNIELKKGWNIISFPYNGVMDAMEVIQPLINAGILQKVQDEQGSSIENWGNLMGWINGIGNFKAGKGYLVQVNQNGVLTIPANYSKSGLILANETKTENFKTVFEGNGSGHMNINIKNLDESDLKIGDEIAAFDGEICVGTVKINASNITNNAVSIQTSVSDNEIINGFTEGKPIELRIWHMNKSVESRPKFELIEGNLKYQKHGSVFVRFIDRETIGFIAFNSIAMDIYPNPASEKVMIKFSQLPETGTQIILTDITGKQLMIRQVQSTQEVLDIQSLSTGLYLLKVTSGENYTVKKLIIN